MLCRLALSVMLLSSVVLSGTSGESAPKSQETVLRGYALDTDWGTKGGDISPDNHFVALDAIKAVSVKYGEEIFEEIQLWDLQTGKVVSSRVLHQQVVPDFIAYWRKHPPTPAFVRYSSDGSKLVVFHEGRLFVFGTTMLDKKLAIDVGEPEAVFFAEADDRAGRAAVVVAWHGGVQLRVYNLESGEVLRKWDFPDAPGAGGLALDPAGRRIAVSLEFFPPGHRRLRASERNIRIFDIESGVLTVAINSGYLASGVAFSPDGTLLTVSANPEVKRFGNDTLKVWNPLTGTLLREFSGGPEGVHRFVQVSQDGKTVLTSAVVTESVGSWIEKNNVDTHFRFRLWDLPTGKSIALSPDLSGSAEVMDPALRLSAKGDLVLVYFSDARRTPPHLYQRAVIPQPASVAGDPQ